MCTLIIASLRDSGFMVGFMTEMEFMVCLIMVNDMGVLIFSTKIVMECDKLEFFFQVPRIKIDSSQKPDPIITNIFFHHYVLQIHHLRRQQWISAIMYVVHALISLDS